MNSFELNKILGAILGTCLTLLALNIAAGAIFTPQKPSKPGFNIAMKEAEGEKAGPKDCSPRRRWKRVNPPRSSARPVTPLIKAGRTVSAPTCGML
jgi:hypothetical protein